MRYPLSFLAILATSAAADSVVVFNEIHYHPEAGEATREYIEFYNQMAVDVDMSGWQITGGVNFTFPAGTIIPGRDYVVVAVDPAGVQAAYGATGVLGPWTGRLSNNGGEELHLRDNNGREMDDVNYGTGGKWPTGPDGGGPSLTKVNPNSASSDAANWTTSWQKGGTPGTANFPNPNAPVHSARRTRFLLADGRSVTGSTIGDAVEERPARLRPVQPAPQALPAPAH